MCKPVAGGGIPASLPIIELRLTFREGGAFDFHTIFEQIKERLYQAYTTARETGAARGADGLDLTNVHLEQLPAYEPASEATTIPGEVDNIASPLHSPTLESGAAFGTGEVSAASTISDAPAAGLPGAKEEEFTAPHGKKLTESDESYGFGVS